MTEQLMNELIKNVKPEDLEGNNKELAEVLGIEKLYELSKYVRGGQIYIPIPELIICQARNRAIYDEWKEGTSKKAIAKKYGLSSDRVSKIIAKIYKNS